MKVTITQLDANQLENEWRRLCAHARQHSSDLVLLPEMCFSPWFPTSNVADLRLWHDAVEIHECWLRRLAELGARIVAGTAPTNVGDKRYNSAYIWTANNSIQWLHHKTYLPNDDGYWEANWYDRAPIDFQAVAIGESCMGVAICTEIWFMQHAREYAKKGIHLLLNPRSTPLGVNDKWLAGGRTAAVVSGAFCLSSNHAGRADHFDLGGAGWICDPEGSVVATTNANQPFATVDLDLRIAETAKSTYPRYIDDRPL